MKDEYWLFPSLDLTTGLINDARLGVEQIKTGNALNGTERCNSYSGTPEFHHSQVGNVEKTFLLNETFLGKNANNIEETLLNVFLIFWKIYKKITIQIHQKKL